MEKESLQAELTRLRKMQRRAEQDEVFGGMSEAERASYDARAKRINELEIEINASAEAIELQRQWNKIAETDTPQSQARQPYRSREKYSTKSGGRRKRGGPTNLTRDDTE